MAANQRKRPSAATEVIRSAPAQSIDMDVIQRGENALRLCTQQKQAAAAMIGQTQAINRENISIRRHLALDTDSPARPLDNFDAWQAHGATSAWRPAPRPPI